MSESSGEMARRWIEARRKADSNWAVIEFSEAGVGGMFSASVDTSAMSVMTAISAKPVEPGALRRIIGDPFTEDDA